MILALAGAAVLAGVAAFGYLGGYWYQLVKQLQEADLTVEDDE